MDGESLIPTLRRQQTQARPQGSIFRGKKATQESLKLFQKQEDMTLRQIERRSMGAK
jgi:hypothetical protein